MAKSCKWYKVPELKGAIGITEIWHYRESDVTPAIATVYKRKRSWYGFAAKNCELEAKCSTADAAKAAAILLM